MTPDVGEYKPLSRRRYSIKKKEEEKKRFR